MPNASHSRRDASSTGGTGAGGGGGGGGTGSGDTGLGKRRTSGEGFETPEASETPTFARTFSPDVRHSSSKPRIPDGGRQ
jgi:hypothetical protein